MDKIKIALYLVIISIIAYLCIVGDKAKDEKSEDEETVYLVNNYESKKTEGTIKTYRKTTIPICWSRDKKGQYFITTYVRLYKLADGIEEEIESKVVIIPVESIRYNGNMIVDVEKCY